MPKTAVVGVSENPSKYGHRIFRDLLENGYDAEGVNPKGGELFGKKIYKSLGEIPQKPATVILVTPPAVSETAAAECAALGVKEIWFQPGSDSPKAVETARKAGIKTVLACFMASKKIW